ncbi:Uncharacterized protein CK203_016874 [Vitis vinifera]|uniref:Single-stranded DNA binding protein Ssb-like OB fold domain-containing protein n=1 Tax=Vitis vinifera TaxID=29760 RepID=A0A438EHZ4_VITVI|nr:Uncharacterized protein CK203_089677 [Vitis vinifera]RVX10553.1 Uncharacterized protein CK203_016874 [Vitis vinifera]
MAESKSGLRKPVFTKIEQLRPGTSGHTLTVKVVSSKMVLQKGRPDGPQVRQMRIAECLVGDETGMIIFTARNDQGIAGKYTKKKPCCWDDAIVKFEMVANLEIGGIVVKPNQFGDWETKCPMDNNGAGFFGYLSRSAPNRTGVTHPQPSPSLNVKQNCIEVKLDMAADLEIGGVVVKDNGFVVITAKSTYCGLMVVHDAEIEVVMGMLKALSLSNWWFAGASYQGGDSRMVAATNVVSGGMVIGGRDYKMLKVITMIMWGNGSGAIVGFEVIFQFDLVVCIKRGCSQNIETSLNNESNSNAQTFYGLSGFRSDKNTRKNEIENTSLASIEQVGIFTEFVWWHLYYLLTNVNMDLMKEGSTVVLRNAKIDMFKGSMRLAVDKWGRVEVTEPASFSVKEDNNLSLVEYELVNVVEE